jgi:putative membrane protein
VRFKGHSIESGGGHMQSSETGQRGGAGGSPASSATSGPAPVDDPRVYLAAERTFLAWIRTSVSLMGFGFLIARFALWLREAHAFGPNSQEPRSGPATWLGFVMVCVGAIVCVMAAIRYREYIDALRRGVTNPPTKSRTSLTMAAAVALVGVAIAIHILML